MQHIAWVLLNKAKHKYNKEIRTAKRGTWKMFCNQIEGASANCQVVQANCQGPHKGTWHIAMS